MIRQIDTGIGIVVGGLAGWYHHGLLIWFALLGVLILWGYLEPKEAEK